MERDHKIRILLGGLHGPEREARKMMILQYGVDRAFASFHTRRRRQRNTRELSAGPILDKAQQESLITLAWGKRG